jgi:hypothetical protein
VASFEEAMSVVEALDNWRRAMRYADLVPVVLVCRPAGPAGNDYAVLPAGPAVTNADVRALILRMADQYRAGDERELIDLDEYLKERKKGGKA